MTTLLCTQNKSHWVQWGWLPTTQVCSWTLCSLGRRGRRFTLLVIFLPPLITLVVPTVVHCMPSLPLQLPWETRWVEREAPLPWSHLVSFSNHWLCSLQSQLNNFYQLHHTDFGTYFSVNMHRISVMRERGYSWLEFALPWWVGVGESGRTMPLPSNKHPEFHWLVSWSKGEGEK